MINSDKIQVAKLCTLQFAEPIELDMYPEQYDYYIPKIWNQFLKVQVFISEDLYESNNLWLRAYDENGVIVYFSKFEVFETAVGSGIYYANVTAPKCAIEAIKQDTIAYFCVEDGNEKLATSLWYVLNPSYSGDLKNITFTHGENDYGVFFNGDEFVITVECGFVPNEYRIEQEQSDFMQQNMVNETVYGDSYEVKTLTIGSGLGIPNWLASKVGYASILDSFVIGEVEHVRVSGAKLESVEKTKQGLGMYNLDLQEVQNYMQQQLKYTPSKIEPNICYIGTNTQFSDNFTTEFE